MMKAWMRGMAMLGLGLIVLAGSAWAQDAGRPSGRAGGDNMGDGDVPGPIDSLQDLQDTAKMMFKMADGNNDGQISQKEATDLGNLMVGGFFFRADANGDGTLSQEEAQQARETLMQQKPLLRIVMREVQRLNRTNQNRNQGNQGNQDTNPALNALSLLDGNNDKQLQASELRQAVTTGVQGLYAAADTNRDGQLSPGELNAATVGMANAAAQAAFQAADADHNGTLSIQEYDKAVIQPARLVFMIIDANDDNQVSPQELQAAQRTFMRQLRMLRVPEPANSPGNLISSGRTPGEVAPVPNVNINPNQPRQPERTQPAPAPAPPQ